MKIGITAAGFNRLAASPFRSEWGLKSAWESSERTRDFVTRMDEEGDPSDMMTAEDEGGQNIFKLFPAQKMIVVFSDSGGLMFRRFRSEEPLHQLWSSMEAWVEKQNLPPEPPSQEQFEWAVEAIEGEQLVAEGVLGGWYWTTEFEVYLPDETELTIEVDGADDIRYPEAIMEETGCDEAEAQRVYEAQMEVKAEGDWAATHSSNLADDVVFKLHEGKLAEAAQLAENLVAIEIEAGKYEDNAYGKFAYMVGEIAREFGDVWDHPILAKRRKS
jgi:hypothetical protein